MPNYIPDGYTLDGCIKPAPGLHDGCTFRYRIILTAKRAEIVRKMERETDAQRSEAVSAVAMAQHIVEWDIVDDKQKPLDITASNLLHLQPTLYRRLWGIIIGMEPSDLKPGGDLPPDQEDMIKAELDMALTGQTPEGN